MGEQILEIREPLFKPLADNISYIADSIQKTDLAEIVLWSRIIPLNSTPLLKSSCLTSLDCFFTLRFVETHALGFILRANAPGGVKRVPIGFQ